MNVLVDTHCLIWALLSPEKLAEAQRDALESADSVSYASSVSFWEISTKHRLGKLHLSGITPEALLTATTDAGFQLLQATAEDMASCHSLPPIDGHKDPFDRLIAWQCIRHGLVLVSSDGALAGYKDHGLRLL